MNRYEGKRWRLGEREKEGGIYLAGWRWRDFFKLLSENMLWLMLTVINGKIEENYLW